MTARTIALPLMASSQDGEVVEIAAARARAYARPLRLRLAVLGSSVGEVVDSAGGWLFDRSLAGWDVTVAVPHMTDSVPVQILGAQAVDLRCAMRLRGKGPQPHAVAVSAELLDREERLRAGLVESLDGGTTEVCVWGGHRLSELSGRVERSEHHLSHAAMVFKRSALIAAGGSGQDVPGTEMFYAGQAVWTAPPARDLMRA